MVSEIPLAAKAFSVSTSIGSFARPSIQIHGTRNERERGLAKQALGCLRLLPKTAYLALITYLDTYYVLRACSANQFYWQFCFDFLKPSRFHYLPIHSLILKYPPLGNLIHPTHHPLFPSTTYLPNLLALQLLLHLRLLLKHSPTIVCLESLCSLRLLEIYTPSFISLYTSATT